MPGTVVGSGRSQGSSANIPVSTGVPHVCALATPPEDKKKQIDATAAKNDSREKRGVRPFSAGRICFPLLSPWCITKTPSHQYLKSAISLHSNIFSPFFRHLFIVLCITGDWSESMTCSLPAYGLPNGEDRIACNPRLFCLCRLVYRVVTPLPRWVFLKRRVVAALRLLTPVAGGPAPHRAPAGLLNRRRMNQILRKKIAVQTSVARSLMTAVNRMMTRTRQMTRSYPMNLNHRMKTSAASFASFASSSSSASFATSCLNRTKRGWMKLLPEMTLLLDMTLLPEMTLLLLRPSVSLKPSCFQGRLLRERRQITPAAERCF